MTKNKFVQFLILGLSCSILIALGALCAIDNWRYRTKGYGFIRGGGPPYWPSMHVLYSVAHAYETSLEEGNQRAGPYPSPETLARIVPDLVLSEYQPYEEYDIYALHSRQTGAKFLYSPNVTRTDSPKFAINGADEPASGPIKIPFVVVACVAATREISPGLYEPYDEYPENIREELGDEFWRQWAVIGADGALWLAVVVESELPPIPGCVYFISEAQRKPESFYYPNQILEALDAVYPGVHVAKEQIIHRAGLE